MLLKRLQTSLHRKKPVQSRLNNISSLFVDFYFGLVNFLIIIGCRKCHTNIAQTSPTLHKIGNIANIEQKGKIARNNIITGNRVVVTTSKEGNKQHLINNMTPENPVLKVSYLLKRLQIIELI